MLTGARFGTSDIKRAIAFYDAVAATNPNSSSPRA